MSRAPPASLVSVTIMRQYHTAAVTPRWVGRSVGVRCEPIMRDKLLQFSASWRWADGVWRRQRRGGNRMSRWRQRRRGRWRKKGKKDPGHQMWLKKNEKGNGNLQKINKDTWTTGSLHTEAGSVFLFYLLFCESLLDT